MTAQDLPRSRFSPILVRVANALRWIFPLDDSPATLRTQRHAGFCCLARRSLAGRIDIPEDAERRLISVTAGAEPGPLWVVAALLAECYIYRSPSFEYRMSYGGRARSDARKLCMADGIVGISSNADAEPVRQHNPPALRALPRGARAPPFHLSIRLSRTVHQGRTSAHVLPARV
ncbi:hypothetical protein BV20DRAFT_816080 [Pilatotrama ljubarskyi]|nr:hypothetical protein BV20DRAFT_816080 [Pilatotrama ljubarskyi]